MTKHTTNYRQKSAELALQLLNDHREACGIRKIKTWKKTPEALFAELKRVEDMAQYGDSPWPEGRS